MFIRQTALSTAEVGIALLDVTGLGSVFCGGAIGRGGNKMCIATDCAVLSHVAAKVTMDTREHPTNREFVFIQSTTTKTHGHIGSVGRQATCACVEIGFKVD
jgi:hypothetical protein